MKRVIKICALLTAVLMLLPLAACTQPGKSTDEGKKTGTEVTVETSPAEASVKPVINETFYGEEIRFFVNGDDGSLDLRSIVIGENDDPDYEVNAKVKERNDLVENELDVKIVLSEHKGMMESAGFLQPILASKLDSYDVLALYQYFDLGLALGDTVGSFYNYLKMPEGSYLNVDAPYWNKSLFETLEYKNVAFFITGDLCQGTVGTMFVSYVNATMWDQYKDTIATLQNNPEGYTSIYDIVNKGYWTMDLWCELSAMPYDDLNANDKIDYEDKLGLIVYNEQLNCIMVDMFAAGAGVTYSNYDSNGDPVIAINTPENVAFFEKLYTLLCENKAACIPWLSGKGPDGDDLYIMDVFAQGNVLLTVSTLENAEEYLADMTDNYYIMPLPMYDRNQFKPGTPSLGYKTQLGDSVSQYAISTAVDPDRIPAITATMELMGYYSMKLVTPAYYDKALKERYTRNLEDAAMIDMIHEGIYADFATVWSQKLGDVTWFGRQHYTEKNKIARNLKKEQDSKTRKLSSETGLLVAIEEAFYVEAY